MAYPRVPTMFGTVFVPILEAVVVFVPKCKLCLGFRTPSGVWAG